MVAFEESRIAPVVWRTSPQRLEFTGHAVGEFIAHHGALLFWTLVGGHALISTLAPALGFVTLPRDTLEGFIWGRSFQWGFFKHPPLQAWILGLSEQFAPNAPWLAYLYAQVCVLLTFWAVWRLGTAILGPAQGLLAALLTLVGVHYYGPSMATFTPDTLSAPLWALTGLTWWRAVIERRSRSWYSFAVVVALSVYAKYVGLLLVGVLGVFTLVDPRARAALREIHPWLAALLCLALVSPHLAWVIDTRFSAFGHAFSYEEKAASWWMRIYFCLSFLAAQLLQHTMLVVLLAACVGWGRIRPSTELVVEGRSVPTYERNAVLVMAAAPILIALAVNLAVGGEFRQGRGHALFAFSGIAALMLLGPRLALGRLKFATVAVLLVVVALPLANAFHHHARLAFGARHVPTLYPAEAMADQIQSRWRAVTNEPLRIVIGDRWHAGNIAFYADDQPLILIDGDFRIAPWVTPDMLERQGGVAIWRPGDSQAMERLQRLLPDLTPDGTVSAVSPIGIGRPFTLAYKILRPAGAPAAPNS